MHLTELDGIRRPAPAEHLGHVRPDRGRDEHLLAVGDEGRQPLTAPGVELGEDVVEDEHRVVAEVTAQEAVCRELESQREAPRLAVAGIALRRELAERQDEVVAVRPDEGDAALDLVGPHLLEALEHAGAQLLDLGHLTGGETRGEVLVERAPVGGPRVGRGCAHGVVALGQVGGEVPQQAQSGIEQLRADRRQMVVPHVEGVQRGLARLVEREVTRRAAGGAAGGRPCAAPGRPTSAGRCAA